jgi:competence protein ComK
MKDYTINQNTLALIPLGKKKTVIYENHDCYIIDEKISKIMDDNCRYNGSSIEGRIKGTYSLTGFNYKAPIIIAEEKDIIFFPTCSPRLKECSWINVNNINKIYSKDEKCLVEFLNDECLEIDASYRIIQNQYLKSLSLKNAFKNRRNN